MKPISNTTASSLEWKDPVAGGPRYELWAGEDLLAALSFGSPCRTLATVETVEGHWTLQQAGFLRPTVHLREEDSDLDLAVFHPGLLGHGQLQFTNGVTFHWRHEGLGSAVWSFRGDGGEVLITLKLEPDLETGPGPHRIQAEVEVTPAGHFSPRVPLLAALGWYLILLHHQDKTAPGPIAQVF
ncbi:MAG: hypothetical protein Q8K67_05205 [Geothrix sp.]|nr:hypothetical protein [Geothrix sp.]